MLASKIFQFEKSASLLEWQKDRQQLRLAETFSNFFFHPPKIIAGAERAAGGYSNLSPD
jgi:hypothetical protein